MKRKFLGWHCSSLIVVSMVAAALLSSCNKTTTTTTTDPNAPKYGGSLTVYTQWGMEDPPF